MSRGWGGRFGGGRFQRLDYERETEVAARFERMEEAIQVMAAEIERLRAAQERDGHYLPPGAESPRVPPTSEDDTRPA
jgi:hypothetical protein